MRKVILMMLLAVVCSSAMAEQNCLQDTSFHIVCAPFGGTVFKDQSFQLVCAPGQCVVVNGSVVKCSGQPGGAAQVQNFQAVCSGGCISPSKKYCAGDLKP